MKKLTILIVSVFVLQGCTTSVKDEVASDYDFPTPVDTNTKPIERQVRQVSDLGGGLYISNDFPAARLNTVERVNDTLIAATVVSENYPVNNSPWYAFKAWANEDQKVYVQLNYKNARHRYFPKTSADGKSWAPLEESNNHMMESDSVFTFQIPVTEDTLWVSAQEIYDSKRVKEWSTELSKNSHVSLSSIGKSTDRRDLLFIDIDNGSKEEKDVIVIFSRQHPPEVTGFFAMQAYVKGILGSDRAEEFLEQFRILVYPLLNPDGVDMGHWRHNAGGIDLNRDWAYYRQPETRAIADHVVKTVAESGGKMMLGLDFHSTYNDVFYTQDKEKQPTPTTPWFREQWFENLEAELEGYKVNEKPLGLASPVTKGWFFTQFAAEGMTYEIGDKTPRDLIVKIGQITAESMIDILLDHE